MGLTHFNCQNFWDILFQFSMLNTQFVTDPDKFMIDLIKDMDWRDFCCTQPISFCS